MKTMDDVKDSIVKGIRKAWFSIAEGDLGVGATYSGRKAREIAADQYVARNTPDVVIFLRLPQSVQQSLMKEALPNKKYVI